MLSSKELRGHCVEEINEEGKEWEKTDMQMNEPQ